MPRQSNGPDREWKLVPLTVRCVMEDWGAASALPGEADASVALGADLSEDPSGVVSVEFEQASESRRKVAARKNAEIVGSLSLIKEEPIKSRSRTLKLAIAKPPAALLVASV